MKSEKQREKEKAISEVNRKYPITDRLCDDAKMEMRSISLDSLYEEYREIAAKISNNDSENITVFVFPFCSISLNICLNDDVMNYIDKKIERLSDASQAKLIVDVFEYFIMRPIDWRSA